MVFNLDLTFERDHQKEHWAKVIGQITGPLHVKASGKGRSFGIWFRPDGFAMFCNVPVKELTDRSIPLDTLMGSAFVDFVENNLVRGDIPNLIEGLNVFFEKRLSHPQHAKKAYIASMVLRRIESLDQNIDLKTLASEYQVSPRYIQKIFMERIGLRPMQYQRILRFQRALDLLRNPPQHGTLTNIAYRSGYFDQSHFIREFKGFTGLLPSEYKVGNHPINQYFLTY